MPRYSIVIPTRNGAETLRATLRTVLAVDYDDYEVVVSDNDQSDATERLIAEIASPRIRYLRAPRPLSMSSNWELGVSAAEGEFILVLGDDDAILKPALREIDQIREATGSRVVRWTAGYYLWPSIPIPGQNNYLRAPLGRRLALRDGRSEIGKVIRFEQCYTELPTVYNSAVHRSVIDEVRTRCGRVFFARIPDVVSGLAIAYVAGQYASTEVPLSVAGISRKSTGLGTLVTPNATGADWHGLNATESFEQFEQVPTHLVFPTVPVAECFLAAKQRLFPHEGELTLDRKKMVQHCVWCLRAETREQWESGFQSIRHSLRDAPELQAWFDLEFASYQVPEPGPLPLRTEPAGCDGVHLHLDTEQFGVTDVAGAAELCQRLLGLNGRSMRSVHQPIATAGHVVIHPSGSIAPAHLLPSKLGEKGSPDRVDSPIVSSRRMVSYAQNGEDVILERIFRDQPTGFYVDVGANDPVVLSVTKHFSNRGWSGINIEPLPDRHRRLCADRPRDVNLNVGVAAEAGQLAFFACSDNDALSTFSEAQAAEHRATGFQFSTRTVPVRPLRDILEECAPQAIDFLTIDVEGFEREVLSSNDWHRWRPRIIVVESTRPSSEEQTHEVWEGRLLDAGYRCVWFDGLNRFYLRAEDAHLAERLQTPPNITDQFETYELVRLRSELEDKHAALHTALATCNELHEHCERLRQQGTQLQQQGQELQQQLEQKHRSQHDALDACAALQRQLQELDAAYQGTTTLHSDVNQLRNQLLELNSSHQSVQAVCDRQQRQLQEKQAAIEDLQSHHQQAETRRTNVIRGLQADIAGLHGALTDKHAALHRAIARSEQLQQQLFEKDAALHAALTACEELRHRNLWRRLRNVA